MLSPHLPALQRHAFVAWGLAALLTLAGATLAIDHLTERHVLADAERASLAWAAHISRNVADVDLVFAGELPSPAAQDVLLGLRGTAGLFRFVLFDPQGQRLLESESVGTRPSAEAGRQLHSASAEQSARSGRPMVTLQKGDGVKRPLIYSEAYVPVLHGNHLVGVVEIHLDQVERAAVSARSFREAAMLAGLALGAFFAVGILLWRWRAAHAHDAEQRLRYLARHDPLTGALNRASFHGALERACAERASNPRSSSFAVLTIDIDDFKTINDLLGQVAGDRMLRQAAERMRSVLRGGDLLARLAGDQFVVLQGGIDDSAAVGLLAQRVIDALRQPFELAGPAIPGSACVGAALHGTDGIDADELLHRADLALRRAKAAGPAGWSFYDAALDGALQERRELTQALRDALAHQSLRLHYQPLYRADGRTLSGYEALTRWPHPLRGFVPPSEFIPLAEEAGLIDALGRWVLHSACCEAASWPLPLTVAVNLSAAQFQRGEAIVDEVREALADSGLAPQRLELEITESLLMNDTEQVLRSLHALHALGVRIAMDDFGTGYSSLAYLWRFPFDKVKIDRAFTHGLGGDDGKVDLIVRSIVGLAHALSMKVNAEGVETAEQRDALRRHGCDELQGFLLGRPQPPEQLAHRSLPLRPEASPAAPTHLQASVLATGKAAAA
jgi:diguanylate cyclase (GGDEF)-like protein